MATPYEATADEPPRKDISRTAALLIAAGIFAVTFFLSAFRQGETIDINSDEATYAIEGVALNQTGLTKWNGGPFFVHPPLHFAIEAAYFRALGVGNSFFFHRLVDKPYQVGTALLAPGDPLSDDNVFNAIMKARYLSIFYGSVIGVLLFFMGRALGGTRLGLLASLLFALDPYLVRRNHFNMLEPLTTLWGIVFLMAVYAAMRNWTHSGRRRAIVLSGVFLGLALLSKELAIIYLPGLVILWLLRRLKLGEVVLSSVIGGLLYGLFPLWAALSGHWAVWWETKSWLLRRLTGIIVDTGLTRPGSSVTHTLSAIYLDYWPSFVVLAAAALLAALFLFAYVFRGLRDLPGEVLTAFVIGCYGFFLVVWRVGGVLNEQFFYLLMPVALLLVGYTVLGWPRLYAASRVSAARKAAARQAWRQSGEGKLRFAENGPDGSSGPQVDPAATVLLDTTPDPRRLGTAQTVLLGILGLLVAYNMIAWVARYGLSTDNSYAQVEGTLAKTLPVGAGVVGRDALDLYMLPKNPVYAFSFFASSGNPLVPVEIIEKKIPYAILNDQAVFERYGGANVPYYNWVIKNGAKILTFNGRLWNTYAYQLDFTSPNLDVSLGADSLSYNKPAVASSEEPPNTAGTAFVAQNAFDGKAGSRWASASADNQWIQVDLGQSRQIRRVELNWEDAYAKTYEIQVSDDARNWTTFSRNDRGAGGFEVGYGSAIARYVRLLLKQRGTQYGFSLWEISVYP